MRCAHAFTSDPPSPSLRFSVRPSLCLPVRAGTFAPLAGGYDDRGLQSLICCVVGARYPSDGKATTGVFHVVCGRSFAAACTYETHYSIWFTVTCPDCVVSVLLWRSKDNPYD